MSQKTVIIIVDPNESLEEDTLLKIMNNLVEDGFLDYDFKVLTNLPKADDDDVSEELGQAIASIELDFKPIHCGSMFDALRAGKQEQAVEHIIALSTTTSDADSVADQIEKLQGEAGTSFECYQMGLSYLETDDDWEDENEDDEWDEDEDEDDDADWTGYSDDEDY